MEAIWNRIVEEQANIRYRQTEYFSPYCESLADSVHLQVDGTTQITMNMFYRFDAIFLPLYDREELSKPIREWLLDCMMHLLTRLEMRSGVDAKECTTRIKCAQIEGGHYGKKLQMLFQELSRKKRYVASWYMVQQEEIGESVSLFAKAMIGIVQDGVVYKDEDHPKELLFYIGREEDEEICNEIEFAKEAFLPLGYHLRIFWKNSFGIIGDDSCMLLDQIEIY